MSETSGSAPAEQLPTPEQFAQAEALLSGISPDALYAIANQTPDERQATIDRLSTANSEYNTNADAILSGSSLAEAGLTEEPNLTAEKVAKEINHTLHLKPRKLKQDPAFDLIKTSRDQWLDTPPDFSTGEDEKAGVESALRLFAQNPSRFDRVTDGARLKNRLNNYDRHADVSEQARQARTSRKEDMDRTTTAYTERLERIRTADAEQAAREEAARQRVASIDSRWEQHTPGAGNLLTQTRRYIDGGILDIDHLYDIAKVANGNRTMPVDPLRPQLSANLLNRNDIRSAAHDWAIDIIDKRFMGADTTETRVAKAELAVELEAYFGAMVNSGVLAGAVGSEKYHRGGGPTPTAQWTTPIAGRKGHNARVNQAQKTRLDANIISDLEQRAENERLRKEAREYREVLGIERDQQERIYRERHEEQRNRNVPSIGNVALHAVGMRLRNVVHPRPTVQPVAEIPGTPPRRRSRRP